MKTIEEAELYEAVEDLIYENCNKDKTESEYETKTGTKRKHTRNSLNKFRLRNISPSR